MDIQQVNGWCLVNSDSIKIMICGDVKITKEKREYLALYMCRLQRLDPLIVFHLTDSEFSTALEELKNKFQFRSRMFYTSTASCVGEEEKNEHYQKYETQIIEETKLDLILCFHDPDNELSANLKWINKFAVAQEIAIFFSSLDDISWTPVLHSVGMQSALMFQSKIPE